MSGWSKLRPVSVFDVGCDLGGNLGWLRDLIPDGWVAGIDVNKIALDERPWAVPDTELRFASAYEISDDVTWWPFEKQA